jgi:hypothetical protein
VARCYPEAIWLIHLTRDTVHRVPTADWNAFHAAIDFPVMVTDNLSLPENTLGYSYNRGGLNNQKLALFGLFLKAFREGPRRLILPSFLVFDIASYNHVPVPFDQALQPGPLSDFAARHGIEVLDISPRGDQGGWDYFHSGNNYIPLAALLNELTPDSFICDFFRSLVPTVQGSDLVHRLADAAFAQRGIHLVAQLRIETDWSYHTSHRLRFVGDTEDNAPSFKDIIKKICNTLPDKPSGIYVVCDETALPVPKDEIYQTIKQDFGIDLFWKSDFLAKTELSELSQLTLSMLDFQMAVAADSFIGLTRSTFSNMVTFEKYARIRRNVDDHYIYNALGPRLAIRRDNGAFSTPALAVVADPWAAGCDFHLAQIFQAAGDRRRALEHYAACAASGRADREEVFNSLCQAAQIKAQLEFSADDVIDTYLRAADVLPYRAEALHGASRCCRYHNMFEEGYEIAGRGIDLAAPAKGLCIEPWIYEWALLDEYAVNAFYAGRYLECADACLAILERGKLPSDHRPRIIRNIQWGIDRLRATEASTERARLLEVKPIDCSRKAHREKMNEPRIYVVNHLPDGGNEQVRGLTPIYVGPAAASAPPDQLTDVLRDGRRLDNRRWSELSAIFKIWQDGPVSDIVGFCDCRRYFDFGSARLFRNINCIGQAEINSIPSNVFDYDKVLIVNDRAAIVPKEMHFTKNVYDQFCENHASSDYLLVLKLALFNYPEIAKYMVEQFNRTTLYACNQFILSWHDFDQLCNFWFGILEKFCDLRSWPREDSYQSKDAGFLAERLFDAWIRFKRDSGHRLVEVPVLQVR